MKYDKKKYKIWNWKSPVVLHWILNPGLAINELILGQTVPKITLIEREGDRPFYQRSLVPCPHCDTMHNGLKWSAQNKTSLKNWFGFYCDNCKGIIPVQRNFTSLIILTLTFPIWGWFRKTLEQKWLKKQPSRYKNINLEFHENKNMTKNWLKLGFYFGLFMFIMMEIIFPLIGGKEITQKSILIGIPLWLITGFIWGFIMKLWMNKKGKKKNSLTK